MFDSLIDINLRTGSRLQLVYTVILKYVTRVSLIIIIIIIIIILKVSSANSSSQATVFEQVCDAGSFFTDAKKEAILLRVIAVMFV